MDERIQDAVNGDQDAIISLLVDNFGWLKRNLRETPRRFQAIVDPEDVLSELSVRILKVGNVFQYLTFSDDDAFRGWLLAAAENARIDLIRRERAKKRGGDWRADATTSEISGRFVNRLTQLAAETTSPSGDLRRSEGQAFIRISLEKLCEEYRQAIKLQCFDGLSREQIAARLGKSVGAVQGLLQRAKRELRSIMRESPF